MRFRWFSLVLSCALLLSGCRAYQDNSLTRIPHGTTFTPIGESAEFSAEGELFLEPDPEQAGHGKGLISVRISSTSGQNLRNLRTVVIYPEQMVELGLLFESHLIVPTSRNLSPERPSYGVGQHFTFPDWNQVERVKSAVLQPIRLRLLWPGGERFLEIPPEAIRLKEEPEHR